MYDLEEYNSECPKILAELARDPLASKNTQPTPASPTYHFSPVVAEGGRVAEWAKGFEKLLDDPDGVKYFQEYLKKEYADENICFWLACRSYESITDPKKRLEEAKSMIAEYLVSGAPNPINIDAIGRAEVIHTAHLGHPDLFKHMQKQIYNLMKYDKFWQFTRSPEYLNLLEQEKIGKAPTFGKQSSETLSTVSQDNKRTMRRNIVSDSSLPRNRRFFSSFLGLMKPSVQKRSDTISSQGERLSEDVANNYVLVEMPNCTVRRAVYNSGESVKSCIERALHNTGINCHCYHVCVKKSGEVLDITQPVSNFCTATLSLYNTPTFQIMLTNGKKLKFCTSHGKTLKDICKSQLTDLNVDIRSTIFYNRDENSYVRMDTSSMQVAGKLLEVKDVSQRSMLPKLHRKMSNKGGTRISHGLVGCSGSLESNLDLLSSVMESSDDEVEINQPTTGLIRSYSQSELEFFELLNRVQCDRLDNQRCSHPTVLKKLTFGDRRDSFKNSKRHSRKHYHRNTLPKVDSTLPECSPKESPLEVYESEEDIAYC